MPNPQVAVSTIPNSNHTAVAAAPTSIGLARVPDIETQIEHAVIAQSTDIEAIMKDASDDMNRFIAYLKQRVELEEGYQRSLGRITENLRQSEAQRKRSIPLRSTMYQAFMDYVNMAENQNAARTEYIQTMKAQLHSLAQLQEQHDKAKRAHRKNMRMINAQYLQARLRELPEARNNYMQKMQELERMQMTPLTPSTPTTPFVGRMTPSISAGTAMTPTTPPLSTTSRRPSDVSENLDDVLKTPINPFAPPSGFANRHLPSPDPMTPTTPHKRIERFMKQISNLGNHPDPAKQTSRVAKLKNEAADADAKYRKSVRKVDSLSKKHDAANEYAIKILRSQLRERTEKVKQALTIVQTAEAAKFEHLQQDLKNSPVRADADFDATMFDSIFDKDQYPMPAPIHYINYHAGECKNLLFGISLAEYAQQYQRSPPLIVTRCIECIESQGGLEREGIYRISGKQSNIDRLKQYFERDEASAVPGQGGVPNDVFSVASVLKIFLRDLASPLFPFKLSDRATYSKIPDKELRLLNLLTRLLKLPAANYDTLKCLIEHFSRLIASVEKNKMSIQNLSLIFTPAIFQDHNQAQRSPGEWCKDCVLEDLIENCESLFANKDLRSASAITGVIEYGFENVGNEPEDQDDAFYAFDLPSPTSSLYEDSPTTEPEQEMNQQHINSDNDTADSSSPSSSSYGSPSSSSPTTITTQHSDVANSTARPLSTEQPKFRAVSQDRGLKVDTSRSTKATSSPSIPSAHPAKPIVPPPPTIQSATVPQQLSFDWLAQDPNTHHDPTRPSLQRSATVGANKSTSSNLKRAARVSRANTNTRV